MSRSPIVFFPALLSLLCVATSVLAADPFLDVTTKVTALVKENTLSVDASNDLFTDPAEGVGKKLRVEYTVDEDAGTRTCNEGETLKLAALPGKKLVVKKATYGDLPEQEDKNTAGVDLSADVTAKVKDAIQNNKLFITANNDALGCDPAFGISKQLHVEYTVDGKNHTATVNEGEDLQLPATSDGAGPLVIIKAKYGANP